MKVNEFHKRLTELYMPPARKFTVVDVPEIRFALIDGKSNPQSDECAEAVKWPYSVVHMVKPLVKRRMGKNFVEPPLECLCWADKKKDVIEGNKDKWKWRVMIVFIDWITQEQFDEAVAKVEQKRGPRPKHYDWKKCMKEKASKSCTSVTTPGSAQSVNDFTTNICQKTT